MSDTQGNDYQARIARLQGLMKEQEARCAILSYSDQMRYLSGTVEGGKKRLVTLIVPDEGEPAFVVPTMHREQFQDNPAGIETVVVWDDATGYATELRDVLTGFRVTPGDVALIDDELYSVHLLALQNLFPTLRCAPADPILAQLRRIKTDAELAAMDEAARLIDAVFEASLSALREGMTEQEFQDAIRGEMRQRGTSESFPSTVCFGANGAEPHHNTGASRLKRGDVIVVDIGCVWDGYASDITRTFAFGETTDPDARKVYDIVSRAHWAAREVARPGVSCAEVDNAARQMIADAGYGDFFTHRTGHGIGLSVHEPPYIHAGDLTILEPGMCFSIEPGVYLPGRFGVRIETIVTVENAGVRSLNADASRQLPIVGA